jgi:hypothetical protein
VVFQNIYHFSPIVFNFFLQKDAWHDGYSGTLGKWAINFGESTYRRGLYWEGESKDANFAYADGTQELKEYEEWEPEEEEIDVSYEEEETALHSEIEDTEE